VRPHSPKWGAAKFFAQLIRAESHSFRKRTRQGAAPENHDLRHAEEKTKPIPSGLTRIEADGLFVSATGGQEALEGPRFRGLVFTQEGVRDANSQTVVSDGVPSANCRAASSRLQHQHIGQRVRLRRQQHPCVGQSAGELDGANVNSIYTALPPAGWQCCCASSPTKTSRARPASNNRQVPAEVPGLSRECLWSSLMFGLTPEPLSGPLTAGLGPRASCHQHSLNPGCTDSSAAGV